MSLVPLTTQSYSLLLSKLTQSCSRKLAVEFTPAWVGILIVDGAYIVDYLKLIPGSLIKVVAETNSQMFYSCLSINLFIFPLAHYFSSPQLFIHILLVLSTLSENLIAQCSGCRKEFDISPQVATYHSLVQKLVGAIAPTVIVLIANVYGHRLIFLVVGAASVQSTLWCWSYFAY